MGKDIKFETHLDMVEWEEHNVETYGDPLTSKKDDTTWLLSMNLVGLLS